jgi:protein-disulfide isomerase
MRITRRVAMAMAALAATALAACAQNAAAPLEGDVAIGAADAPVTIVEYMSTTCGHCAQFHQDVFPTIEERFIETGQVRYVFRELLTAPQSVSLAGFQIARCGNATPDQYAARLKTIFARQHEILSGTESNVRQQLLFIGRSAGLSEEQMNACIADPAATARAQAFVEQAQRDGVTGTPAIILNGERMTTAQDMTAEGLTARIEAALAAAQQ